MNVDAPSDLERAQRGSPAEVFGAFLKLGLTSFGGPIAHLAYFRDELVLRRQWIDEAAYADLVALCQFLPGPASSQVGFALGLRRSGLLGGLAAWTAFTLPSALALMLFALWASALAGPLGQGVLHGLKLVAVAVVAHAVWGMAKALCPDAPRAAIAVLAAAIVWFAGMAAVQVLVIAVGALLGSAWVRATAKPQLGHLDPPLSRRTGALLLTVAVALLVLLPLARWQPQLALFDAFYRAGALVFGGGHVVLPLLEAEVVQPGWVSQSDFIAGYGAAQAVPGPLFTFAAYLGALADPRAGGVVGALIALIGVFLAGLLLVAAALPFWEALRARPAAQAAIAGANAAVVGILAAAWADPVFSNSVHSLADFALAAIGFVLLVKWRVPPWAVVLLLVAAAVLLVATGW